MTEKWQLRASTCRGIGFGVWRGIFILISDTVDVNYYSYK